MASARPATMIEKILGRHAGGVPVRPGEVVELEADARVAGDSAGVVEQLEARGLGVADPARTFIALDGGPGYAVYRQRLRAFARRHGVRLFDRHHGVGTHLAVEHGFAWPGSTLVSTDPLANILGGIGAFGQGLGELDIAAAFARGRVWFRVPPTVKVVLEGRPGPLASAKDIALALLRRFGTAGLLGAAVEIAGDVVPSLGLDARLTLASLAGEMGAVLALIPPSPEILEMARLAGLEPEDTAADEGAVYADVVEVDLEGLAPLVSCPGCPGGVVPLAEVAGRPVESAFIGSGANGRIGDLRAAVGALYGRTVAPQVVLEVVPATDLTWRQALDEGLLGELKRAGALVANAGAAGQAGPGGPGEVAVSTGIRNPRGEAGEGEVWLASPAVAAASAVAGCLASPDAIPERPVQVQVPPAPPPGPAPGRPAAAPPTVLEGRTVWAGREGPPAGIRPGDLVVGGAGLGEGPGWEGGAENLGAAALLAPSFAGRFEREAVNAALPLLRVDLGAVGDGERLRVDLAAGTVERISTRERIQGEPMPAVALAIYRRGGLLAPAGEGD